MSEEDEDDDDDDGDGQRAATLGGKQFNSVEWESDKEQWHWTGLVLCILLDWLHPDSYHLHS